MTKIKCKKRIKTRRFNAKREFIKQMVLSRISREEYNLNLKETKDIINKIYNGENIKIEDSILL